jgi:hypothetical protein
VCWRALRQERRRKRRRCWLCRGRGCGRGGRSSGRGGRCTPGGLGERGRVRVSPTWHTIERHAACARVARGRRGVRLEAAEKGAASCFRRAYPGTVIVGHAVLFRTRRRRVPRPKPRPMITPEAPMDAPQRLAGRPLGVAKRQMRRRTGKGAQQTIARRAIAWRPPPARRAFVRGIRSNCRGTLDAVGLWRCAAHGPWRIADRYPTIGSWAESRSRTT